MPTVLLATDLDRTLLDDHAQIPDCCIESIRRFTDAGGLFTVATGRPTRGVLQYPQLVSLINAPVISYNGACIYDTVACRALWKACLPEDIGPLIQRTLDQFPGVGALVFRGEDDCTTVSQPNAYTYEVAWLREHYHAREQVLHTIAPPWTKVVIAGPEADMVRCASFLRSLITSPIHTILSEGTFLEIIVPGANKGNALSRVAELCKVERSSVLAIGDSMNDIEMVRWAGIGGAVSNAEPAVAQVARMKVPSNTEYGIIDFIDRGAMPLLRGSCQEVIV